MKFKVGDKVRPTHEYMAEHARSYKVLWGEDWPGDNPYENMKIVSIENDLIMTDASGIPWLEKELDLIK